MKIFQEFITKKNHKVQIIEPTLELLDEMVIFVNRLAKENTFLSFDPSKEMTREDEEKSILNQIERNANGFGALRWAICDNKIVGLVDIRHITNVREYHIGNVSIMVDQDFRGEGIGTFLMEMIFDLGRKIGIRTAILDVFSDNEPARALYAKVGMNEYGVLPDGLYRNKKFSSKILMSKRLL